jgi:hypothetical protein
MLSRIWMRVSSSTKMAVALSSLEKGGVTMTYSEETEYLHPAQGHVDRGAAYLDGDNGV